MAKRTAPNIPARTLAAAAFEAVRVLVWQSSYFGAVSGNVLADELEVAAAGETGDTSELLLFLAAIARRGAVPDFRLPGEPAGADD